VLRVALLVRVPPLLLLAGVAQRPVGLLGLAVLAAQLPMEPL
jgi:hypothetical protein